MNVPEAVRAAGRAMLALAAVAPMLALASGLTGNEPIDTIAGTGASGGAGDGGPALAATFNVMALHVARTGEIYFVDYSNNTVRRIDSAGNISRVAGNGTAGFSGDGMPATQAQLQFPTGVAVDAQGNLYIADRGNNRIRKVTAATGVISTIAGGNSTTGFAGDGGPASAAWLGFPFGVAIGPDGALYIADTDNQRIRKVDAAGLISTVAGNGARVPTGPAGDGGPALQASFGNPMDVAFDTAGNMFIADAGRNSVRKVDGAGTMQTLAGGGTLTADGTPGPQFGFGTISWGLAVDGYGNVFVGTTGVGAKRIYKIDAAAPHAVRAVAGTGTEGFAGDGGPALQARMRWIYSLDFDGQGNLYFGDVSRIRKITAPTADLRVEKSCAPAQVAVNQAFTCTVRVTNSGPASADAVYFDDLLSPAAGVTLVSASASAGACPTATANRVSCELGTLAPGGTATVMITLSASQPGSYDDVAAASSPTGDPDPGNNSAAFRTEVIAPDLPADLSIVKEAASAFVTLGREAPFVIRVTNNGANPANQVRVSDIPAIPPTGVIAPAPWACTNTAIAPNCMLGALAPGQSAPRIQVTLTPSAAGQFCNSASVSAVQTDPNPANNLAPQVCVTVVAPFRLSQFVAFAAERLLIDRRSVVASGAVGVNTRAANDSPEVFLRGLRLVHPAFFALGDTVLLDASRVPEVRSNAPAQLLNGAQAGAQNPAGSFPVLTLPALTPANPQTQASGDVSVAANQTRGLLPGRYRDLVVNEGATLNLRGFTRLSDPADRRSYEFRSIELKAGAKILFGAPSVGLTGYPLGMTVRVQNRLRASSGAVIGPSSGQGGLNGSHIVFQVGGDDLPAFQPQNVVHAVNIGRNSNVRANIYAPNGTLLLDVGVRGTGAFIGRNFAGNAVSLTLESAFQF